MEPVRTGGAHIYLGLLLRENSLLYHRDWTTAPAAGSVDAWCRETRLLAIELGATPSRWSNYGDAMNDLVQGSELIQTPCADSRL